MIRCYNRHTKKRTNVRFFVASGKNLIKNADFLLKSSKFTKRRDKTGNRKIFFIQPKKINGGKTNDNRNVWRMRETGCSESYRGRIIQIPMSVLRDKNGETNFYQVSLYQGRSASQIKKSNWIRIVCRDRKVRLRQCLSKTFQNTASKIVWREQTNSICKVIDNRKNS